MRFEKIILTGATGFMGRLLIPFLLKEYRPSSLRMFGRSEWIMTQILRENNDTKQDILRAFVGDIRDFNRIKRAMSGADLVIHCAAMKRVEVISYNPDEAIKTNVGGSMNVLYAALDTKPHKVIFVSSDKAVNPKNLYGRTKSVMESMVLAHSREESPPPILTVTRWGNVCGSTGAVIPFFIQKAKNNEPLPINNPEMTRFLVTKQLLLDSMKRAIDEGRHGEVVIPNELVSVNILEAAKAIRESLSSSSEIIMQKEYPNEKLHEEMSEGITSDNYLIDKTRFIELLKGDGLL